MIDLDLDTLSGMAPLRLVTYSLGSNLGDRLEYLQGATALLNATPGMKVTGISSIYETDPVELTDQPEFLNVVVQVESTLASTVMLERAQAIENAFDRIRTVRFGPRTIDVDLIAVADRVINSDLLTLPHPRAHERAFVLVPWLEIDPGATLVGRGPVADLVAKLDTSVVRRRDDLAIEI